MSSAKWRPFCLGLNVFINKQLGVYGGVINAVATDGQVCV